MDSVIRFINSCFEIKIYKIQILLNFVDYRLDITNTKKNTI